MGNFRISRAIIIALPFLLVILSILVYTQTNSTMSQKDVTNDKKTTLQVQGGSLKDSPTKEDFYIELFKQTSNNTDKIITLITFVILSLSVFLPILIWFLEWRTIKENRDFQKKINLNLKEMKEMLFPNLIKDEVSKHEKSFETTLKTQIKNYERILIGRMEYEVEPIEYRFMKAERFRSDIWDRLIPELNKALEKQNWSDYLKGWTDFHKLQEALSQILSKNPNDICNGLGTFESLYPTGIVPDSLWVLICLLKKQNRMDNLRVIEIGQRLAKKMGKKWEDEIETPADND
ncbi:MAG TPA: hypothetical protein VK186_16565 [Candidatus Deferrimicrobium sp.]|nr:hypothetical protein [Candidatus Kapabacteria bacterium]HLP60455.1 hypothetical protein [Candidatus Deferrimicrobium sp.]